MIRGNLRPKAIFRLVVIGCALALLMALVFIIVWFYSYRYEWLISFQSTPYMKRASIEGYTDQLHYSTPDTATFYIRSALHSGHGVLRKVTGPYSFDTLSSYFFDKVQQPIGGNPPVKGLNWEPTFRLPLSDAFSSGIYNLHLTNQRDTSNITFSIGNYSREPEVTILLPTTTWVAYNEWGGKSLYVNGVDSSKVYKVSAQRPMTALNYSRKRNRHSVAVQANIVNWFQDRYQTVVLPDYSLEFMPGSLRNADIIVLAYHCEYFSKPMYDNLEKLVNQHNTSLIGLGGNQVYWRVQWRKGYRSLACRKDLTFFDNTWAYGGMWRHHLRPEARLLGVQFSPSGMGTYAPYQVKKPDHWLFNGAQVKKGMLFGKQGINSYPICGDETDKTTWFSPSGTVVLAKGLNPKHNGNSSTYSEQANWKGKGGGALVYRQVDKQTGVLATGSIQSGSGLGTDSVFTTVLRNFMAKHQ